ncbi:hypothetical protein [Micromonospora echinospora]|uniref:hypothetical protein n=1 Tax=Micromonospora echinospora TaxID=1877 RepID=UPI003A8AEC17
MITRIVLALAVLLLIAGGWVLWICDRELIRRAARIDAQDAELTRLTAERDGLAVKVRHLTGRNADLRAELARMTAAVHLTPDADPLEALYALPAYDPEGNR